MTRPMEDAGRFFEAASVAALIIGRDGADRWAVRYQNPAARALVGERGTELERVLAPRLDLPDGEERAWEERLWDRDLTFHVSPCGEKERLCFITDRTEENRRRQESEQASRAALQSALEAANAANRAKSDFLSSMSHDIRTPLNAIVGMTAIARSHLDQRERVADCLEKIDLSSRHLLALINDILDMSRIESGKMTIAPESFAMADFIHSLLAVFRPQADKKRQRVELDFSGLRHEQVRGDELRIQQVLINILSNAVKFTPEEGTISLTVREMAAESKAGHNYSYYEFKVRDTGMGMSPEFLEKVFQPFERASAAARIEGTGLGMTITHNLVKMMNGEIAVESEEGVGTVFTVTLPLERDGDGDVGLSALRNKRVLAADRDEASLKNLREILSDLGMTCDTCGSAHEATELAAAAHTEGRDYFAILLGWRLPVVDGVQACHELRAILGGEVPIFVMSSFEWTLTADEMAKYGVTGFIPKPLFRSRLGQALYAWTDEGRTKAEQDAMNGRESFEGFRVLLVEDNELNREIGVELIEMLGAKADCAEDGKQAVDRFLASPAGTYDLIFMDIQMPVMNGLEAARAIRALPEGRGMRVPIVAMSANAFVEDIRASERAGMNAHVPKPVSLESLTGVMRRFLRRPERGQG